MGRGFVGSRRQGEERGAFRTWSTFSTFQETYENDATQYKPMTCKSEATDATEWKARASHLDYRAVVQEDEVPFGYRFGLSLQVIHRHGRPLRMVGPHFPRGKSAVQSEMAGGPTGPCNQA